MPQRVAGCEGAMDLYGFGMVFCLLLSGWLVVGGCLAESGWIVVMLVGGGGLVGQPD